MAMADMPGGVGPGASGAELEPIPALVAKCARLGTRFGDNEAIGSDLAIVGHSENTDRFPYDMKSTWRGPLSVGGVVCDGTVSYGNSLELKAGKLTQRVPGRLIVRVPASASREEADGKKTRKGVIDTRRICEIEGPDGTVKLVERETKSFKVKGFPALYVTHTTPLGEFTCDAAGQSTGGVGPDTGNGSGGVDVR